MLLTDGQVRALVQCFLEVDSGCPTCVKQLLKDVVGEVPAFKDLALAEFEKKFEYPLDLEGVG